MTMRNSYNCRRDGETPWRQAGHRYGRSVDIILDSAAGLQIPTKNAPAVRKHGLINLMTLHQNGGYALTRRLRYTGVILAAFLSALVMTLLLMFSIRNPVLSQVVFGLYLLLPIGLLVWSILTYVKRRNALFLTFGISFFVSTIIFFGLFVTMLVMALHSFT